MRYYDHVGLLRPTAWSEAGRRLYSEQDFARLQQILTLKLIGLSLGEINTLLTADTGEICALLERQRQVLEEQAQRLQTVVAAIERAQKAMETNPSIHIDQFVAIIQAVSMSTDTDWLKQFLSGEQRKRLVAHHALQSMGETKAMGAAWQALFQDIFAALDSDTDLPEVQALVERWDSMIELYGSVDAASGLNSAYSHLDSAPDVEQLPPELREWTHKLASAARFIERARRA